MMEAEQMGMDAMLAVLEMKLVGPALLEMEILMQVAYLYVETD